MRDLVQRRVLVTGGAGFIGSELVRLLVEKGAEIVVLDNLATGTLERLSDVSQKQLTVCLGDIRDGDAVRTAMVGVDTVYHLACLGVRHSLGEPRQNFDVNGKGTLTLMEVAAAAGVARLVHVSTSEVYGPAQSIPMTESHPTMPTTVYGASKLAGEAIARAWHHTQGLPVVLVRPFNTFGPRCHHEGDRGEVIPRFLLHALSGRPLTIFGDGMQTRDFTFVEDTAKGILLAGQVEGIEGETFNLGSGRELSLLEVAETVSGLVSDGLERKPARIHQKARPGDVSRLIADASKAKAILGWEPATEFEDGLRRLIKWYEELGKAPECLLADAPERNWSGNTID